MGQTGLLTRSVHDLEDFTHHHDEYLVDIFTQTHEAKESWLSQVADHGVADSFVQLSYHGRALFAPDLWDEVAGIWFILVDGIGEYLQLQAEGHRVISVERSFPDQPVPLRLERKSASTLITINKSRAKVEPSDFFPGVLGEANRFYQWVENNVGVHETEVRARISTWLTLATER